MSFCRDHVQFATSILLGQLTFNSLMFLIALLLLLFLFNIFLLLAETLNIHPSLEMMAKVSLECSKSKYSGPLWCAKRSHNQGLTSHITHTITSDAMHHCTVGVQMVLKLEEATFSYIASLLRFKGT